jgi:dTMP kinase
VFIVLEGLDGAGTTTQGRRLAQHLGAHFTQEPSAGAIGRLIRTTLRGERAADDAELALLFAADRLHHFRTEIAAKLTQGPVVCDRYRLSSLAYQGLTLPRDWVRALNARAPEPDKTLFLRVAPAVCARRRQLRGDPPERFDSDATQCSVALAYESLLREAPGVTIIDGEQSEDTVAAEIWRALRP